MSSERPASLPTAPEIVANLVFGAVVDEQCFRHRRGLVVDASPLGVDPGDDDAVWVFTAFDVLVVTGETIRVTCQVVA